jgi:hypothetical protein
MTRNNFGHPEMKLHAVARALCRYEVGTRSPDSAVSTKLRALSPAEWRGDIQAPARDPELALDRSHISMLKREQDQEQESRAWRLNFATTTRTHGAGNQFALIENAD